MGQEVYSAIARHFQEHQTPYREINHAPGASTEEYHQAVGCRYEQQIKCVFLRVIEAQGTSYAICAIPAQKKVNLKQIRRLLNVKEVRLATRDELNAVTGCDYGELAPTGKLFGIPLLLDIDFTREQEIFMNAGRVDVSFVLHPDDLLRLEEPLIFQME
ncbi:MAG: YbaK/EbsC family protein [Anaerolineae bacterium]